MSAPLLALLVATVLLRDAVVSLAVLLLCTIAAVLAGVSLRQWGARLLPALLFVGASCLPFLLPTPSASPDAVPQTSAARRPPASTSATAAPDVGTSSVRLAVQGTRVTYATHLAAQAMAASACLLLMVTLVPMHHLVWLLRRARTPMLLTDTLLLVGRLLPDLDARRVARQRYSTLRHGDVSRGARWRTVSWLGAAILRDVFTRTTALERGLDARGGFSTDTAVAPSWRPLRRGVVLLRLSTITTAGAIVASYG